MRAREVARGCGAMCDDRDSRLAVGCRGPVVCVGADPPVRCTAPTDRLELAGRARVLSSAVMSPCMLSGSQGMESSLTGYNLLVKNQ